MLQSFLGILGRDLLIYFAYYKKTRGDACHGLNEWLPWNLCGKIHVSRFKAIHNCCTFVQPRHSRVIKLRLNRFTEQ